MPAVGAPLYPPIVYTVDDIEQYRAVLDEYLREKAGGSGVPLAAEVIEGGPARTIVERASTLPADLVVLGTHGRGGFERLVLGSVTERVLRHAPCPVLTVPPRAPDAIPAWPILYKRILCAVDFSPSSSKALSYAASLAMEADAHLSLLHVVETPVPALEPVLTSGSGLGPLEQELRASALRRLRGSLGDDTRTYCDVHEAVTTGKPYREILRYAEQETVDVIVMGVHGGVAGALAFGSTTNNVVRAAPCAVLTLRA
jgi:nucleotide-binding universal stress UspA family protein